MSVAIKIEDLSKAYQLGEIGTGTISRDLERWYARIRGKEDPFLKIGETNDRSVKGTSDIVWSLKDINLEIEQGTAIGIIGKNGAGKSTLLKILSRITSPTTGSVKIKGRVASLLEVGTGFHPELTGKENIYLNGAILGMRKKEIARKFDEIVSFAGVERYIDTPVKRYSSGMYVRLAFAVAAHLDSEILIVDEVLAVGDAEFQKKCLGKMGEVSRGQGRTVLFVSHNMTAIKSLCSEVVWLSNGIISGMGETNMMIEKYLSYGADKTGEREIDLGNDERFSNEYIRFLKVAVESSNEMIRVTDPLSIYFEFENNAGNADLNMSMVVYNREEACVFNTASKVIQAGNGKLSARCFIPANFLNDEFYSVRILIVKDGSTVLINIPDIISFEINDVPRDGNWYGKWVGMVRPQMDWEFGVNNIR